MSGTVPLLPPYAFHGLDSDTQSSIKVYADWTFYGFYSGDYAEEFWALSSRVKQPHCWGRDKQGVSKRRQPITNLRCVTSKQSEDLVINALKWSQR